MREHEEMFADLTGRRSGVCPSAVVTTRSLFGSAMTGWCGRSLLRTRYNRPRRCRNPVAEASPFHDSVLRSDNLEPASHGVVLRQQGTNAGGATR